MGSGPSSQDPSAAPALPDDAVEVGRIVGAWGVKGAIRVKPFAVDPQALFSTKRWYVQAAAPAHRPGPKKPAALPSWPALLRIVSAREHGDHIVATAHDLDDRDAAQALAGARVFVARSSFPTPEADEYYWVDLIGLDVQNREGLTLGAVTGLLETGPVCVLRVQPAAAEAAGPAGRVTETPAEVLIPFASAYIDRVDLPARCIHVDWQPDY